jgi:transcriptional regulator with XRE-family HTH domain
MMYPVVAMPSLKELRERASMSQAELADLVGVRYQLVSDWERGVYTPRPSNVRKLCRALSCKREELEFNIPDPNPLAGVSCLPVDDRQMERDSMIQRIIELEEQVKTGTTMLDDLVKMVEESEARIDSQQEYIDKLTALLKTHGLDHYIKRL